MNGRRHCYMCHGCSLLEGDIGEPSHGQKSVSVASQCVCFICISCVSMCLLHMYQLRLNVSASYVSVASQCVCFICISCVPVCLLHVYQLRHKLSTARLKNCFNCVPRNLHHVGHTETRPNLPNRTGKRTRSAARDNFVVLKLCDRLSGYKFVTVYRLWIVYTNICLDLFDPKRCLPVSISALLIFYNFI